MSMNYQTFTHYSTDTVEQKKKKTLNSRKYDFMCAQDVIDETEPPLSSVKM